MTHIQRTTSEDDCVTSASQRCLLFTGPLISAKCGRDTGQAVIIAFAVVAGSMKAML